MATAGACIAIAALPATSMADSPEPTVAAPLKVVVLPVRAHVSRAGFAKAGEVDEWSELARVNINSAVEQLFSQAPTLITMAPPEMTAEERSAVDEFVAVATLATTQFESFSGFGGPRAQRAPADRVLGPSLSFLRDRTAASHALGTFAFQFEQSKTLAAFGALVILSPLAGNVLPVPPITFSYVTMFIADLDTGELRWFDVEGGIEMAGINSSDLRDPDSVLKMVGTLLEGYQNGPKAEGNKEERQAGPTRPATPAQGEFAVQAPAGWSVNEYDTMIQATRGSRALNEITVELRDHSRSFLTIGRRTLPNTRTDKLAGWYVAALEQQNLIDLQIIDISTDAELVGKPAFRVRFSHRLPMFVGGARIEVMAVGTTVPNGLLIARLDAPQLGYFAKAVPAFDETLQSIVLTSRRHRQ